MSQLKVDPQHIIDVLRERLGAAVNENVVLTAAINQLQSQNEELQQMIQQKDSTIQQLQPQGGKPEGEAA